MGYLLNVVDEHVRRPSEALAAKPRGSESFAAMRAERLRNGCLVGLGGGSGKGERDLAQTEIEQAIAAAGLAVVVALGRGPSEDLDLPVVEANRR